MGNKGKILLGLIAFAFVGLIVWAVSTVPDPPAPEPEPEGPRIMSYGGNTITEEKNGVKIWDLTAEKMDIDVDTQDADCENLLGHFYEESGRVLEVTAPHGTYRHDTRDIVLDRGVKATTNDGWQLTCDKLSWLAADSMLVAEGSEEKVAEIENKEEGMYASAKRLESLDSFKRFRAIGKAHLVSSKK